MDEKFDQFCSGFAMNRTVSARESILYIRHAMRRIVSKLSGGALAQFGTHECNTVREKMSSNTVPLKCAKFHTSGRSEYFISAPSFCI